MLQVQSANMITKLHLRVFIVLNILLASVVAKTLSSPDYFCNEENSPCSSLSTLTSARPYLAGPNLGVRHSERKRRKRKMWMIGACTAVGVGLTACIGIGIAFLWAHWSKKRSNGGDVEKQQLSLSVRTTSEKKVSFDGSQYNVDDHKGRVETYTLEDLQKATQDFCQGNLIQGSVFQGRLKGKTVAIKRVASGSMSKIDGMILHRSPNILRVLGSCVMDGPDSFLVLEYASNGSLKDWIHGGLAMKSHFIASCSCFLSWNQRLKICVDVATALQHMHHIMNPSYVHGNIRSGNVFLDDYFGAKVGMPKLSDGDEEKGEMSPSTDMFAYGVVLLEVLSGKPPAADGRACHEIRQILQSEDAEELRGWMDGALGENYSFDGAVTLANIARSCVEEDASSRPNAGEVVDKLLRLVEELDMPVGEELISESSCRPLVM